MIERIERERNLLIEVIATDSHDLTRELGELRLDIHTSEIITDTFNQPFNYFKNSQGRPAVDEDGTADHSPADDR